MRSTAIAAILFLCQASSAATGAEPAWLQTIAPEERKAASALLAANIGVGEDGGHITSIGIGRNPHGRMDDTLMQCLASLPELQIVSLLDVPRAKVTADGLAFVGTLSKLEDLDLQGVYLTDAGIAHLRGCARLKRLMLSDGAVSAKGLANLGGLKRLEVLQLGKQQIGDPDLTVIGTLSKLKSLSLDGLSISDEGMAHLANLGELQTLMLAGTEVSDDGMQILARLPNVEQLNLMNTLVTDKGLKSLRALSKLAEVNVVGTRVTEIGVARFIADADPRKVSVEWRSDSSPKKSRSDPNALTIAGIVPAERTNAEKLLDKTTMIRQSDGHVEIVRLAPGSADAQLEICGTFKELKSLRASNGILTDKAMASLAHLARLEVLELQQDGIRSGSMKHLANLTNLKIVDLTDNPIDNEGVKSLSAIVGLTDLRLAGTQVTDDVVEILAPLTRLKIISFPPTVSIEAVARFRAAHPHARISR